MPTAERTQDRGRIQAARLLTNLSSELREGRLAAGVSQAHLARITGLSQPTISRIERDSRARVSIQDVAVLSVALGLKASIKLYPVGSPVRDVAQLRLLERFRRHVGGGLQWRTEVPVGGQGDLRAWDVVLGSEPNIGIEAETRLHDMQATQRRLELKWRDSGVDRVILLISRTRHNRAVLREHRAALLSTLPLSTPQILPVLRAGHVPDQNGIVAV